MASYFIGYLFGVVLVCIICGFISQAIASSRGMDGGFWWGFWLWIIGIIVVAVRPNDKPVHYQYAPAPKSKQEREKEILAAGGWKCDCGEVNYDYVTSCSCGRSKRDVEQRRLAARKAAEERKIAETYKPVKTNAEQIREYKELLDIGAITQEEYEAKKKQLLGLLNENDTPEQEQKQRDLEDGKEKKISSLADGQTVSMPTNVMDRQKLIYEIANAMNLISPNMQRAKLKQINVESGKEVIDFLLSLSDDELKPIANTILKKLKDEA